MRDYINRSPAGSSGVGQRWWGDLYPRFGRRWFVRVEQSTDPEGDFPALPRARSQVPNTLHPGNVGQSHSQGDRPFIIPATPSRYANARFEQAVRGSGLYVKKSVVKGPTHFPRVRCPCLLSDCLSRTTENWFWQARTESETQTTTRDGNSENFQ